jgi:hypothetical protein
MVKKKTPYPESLSSAAELILELIQAKNGEVTDLIHIKFQCKIRGIGDLDTAVGITEIFMEGLAKKAEIIPADPSKGKFGLLLAAESEREKIREGFLHRNKLR